jgi:DNA-binding SARP family transcriptional activator
MEMREAELPLELTVHVATAQVRQRGAVVPLRHREREIAVAIAVQGRPVSLESVCELLYPERDSADARNMVKVNVYRLRRRLGPSCVVHRDGGYVLGAGAVVDIAQARSFIRGYSARPGWIDPDERDRMLALARGLRQEPPAAMLASAWHEAVALRARRVGHDAAMLIARAALERGELRTAASIARELTYEDSCDEEAWDLLIRAQLRSGEAAAARQGFRFLATALAKELDVMPSPSIRRLIEAEPSAIAI